MAKSHHLEKDRLANVIAAIQILGVFDCSSGNPIVRLKCPTALTPPDRNKAARGAARVLRRSGVDAAIGEQAKDLLSQPEPPATAERPRNCCRQYRERGQQCTGASR